MKGEQLFICGLSIDWNGIDEDSYLRNIPAIAGISELEFSSPVTFLVGENGTGKSTLLEAMAVAYGFNAEGGTRNYNFSTYDSHSKLSESLRLRRPDTSSEPRASITWLPQRRSTADTAAFLCICTRCPTGRAFSGPRRTISGTAAYTSWTSLRRRCLHRGR